MRAHQAMKKNKTKTRKKRMATIPKTVFWFCSNNAPSSSPLQQRHHTTIHPIPINGYIHTPTTRIRPTRVRTLITSTIPNNKEEDTHHFHP